MMTTKPPNAAPRDPKPSKRSILGLLFNPQLGPALTPLRDSTRIFIQLLATVFSLYGLFPKDHPALRDDSTPLSLSTVIGTAWQNVRLTREGLPQAIIFFVVTGIMIFSAVAVMLALLGLVMGHAHAADASMFTAPDTNNDLAQRWMDYLFNVPSGGAPTTYPTVNGESGYGDATPVLSDPFAGSVINAQTAFINMLGFYSNAILVVAAIILFYHLASMVVETAHHGVPMGKRASQIWAPIRLVFAIGLLVPVNDGLNCGQFVIIKMVELGSGMASNAWSTFIGNFTNYNPTPPPVLSEASTKIASDIIVMKACQEAWNYRVNEASGMAQAATMYMPDGGGPINLSLSAMPDPQGTPFVLGGIPGTKYSYTSSSIPDVDICGWYFIPNGGSSGIQSAAAKAQQSALSTSMGNFKTAADEIQPILSSAPPSQPVPLTAAVNKAAIAYQNNLNTEMQGLATTQAIQTNSAIATMTKYGWVMAGAFLNTIARIQAGTASAIEDSMPVTSPPKLDDVNKDKPGGFWARLTGKVNDEAWEVREHTVQDVHNYMILESKSMSSTSADTAECASMAGLQTTSEAVAGGWATNAVEFIFAQVDRMAQDYGVWSSGTGAPCGVNTAANPGAKGFKLGIQIGGSDPFAQMAALGHANLNIAFNLLGWSMGASVAGGATTGIGALMGNVGAAISGLFSSGFAGASTVYAFLALIFFLCGFTLAFLVPLMPFMRFFFSVLAWVAAIFEAIIAVPLIALAHLNPEGEGLPGQQARNAYFFIFNLFLRPILTVFGLICGLVLFLVAVSFLNYAYAIAVSGAGGTAYGHATMSKIVYSILYVAILYISANHSFQLIDHLPQHALSWMGASAQAIPNMGDVGKFEQLGSLVSSYAGQRTIESLGSVSRSAGEHIAGLGKGVGAQISANDSALAKKKELEDTRKFREAMLAKGSGGSSPPPEPPSLGGPPPTGGSPGGGGGAIPYIGGLGGGGNFATPISGTATASLGTSLTGTQASAAATPGQPGSTSPPSSAEHEGAGSTEPDGKTIQDVMNNQAKTNDQVASLTGRVSGLERGDSKNT